MRVQGFRAYGLGFRVFSARDSTFYCSGLRAFLKVLQGIEHFVVVA